MIDVVAEARERNLKARAAAVAPVAEESPMEPAPTDEPMDEPEAPEPEPEDRPAFGEGARVMSGDSRRPAGTVSGPAYMARCYPVEPEDGSPAYMSVESELSPYQAPTEEPMTDETIAPEGLTSALGIKAGSTLGDCAAAATVLRQNLDRETAEAKGSALDAAGVHASLRNLVMGSLQREEGENWATAANRVKGQMPEAFKAAQPVASATEAKPAPVGQAPVSGGIPTAVGSALGGESPKAEATPAKAKGPTFINGQFQ